MVVDVNVLTSGWTIAGVIASFLVAAVALGLGVSSFIQTKNFQKKERRERLLNEIIDWAIDITNLRCGSKKIFKEIADIKDIKQLEIFIQAHIAETGEICLGMSGRNQYVSSITREFKKDLQQAVIKLTEELKLYIELLSEWWKFKGDAIKQDLVKSEEYIKKDGEYATKADEYMLQVDKSANGVIEEATKIKTRDIS